MTGNSIVRYTGVEVIRGHGLANVLIAWDFHLLILVHVHSTLD